MATEKRLIDANVTINVFTKWLTSTYDGRMPKDVVAEIPTVDAVEVVRCKNCIYRFEPDDDRIACGILGGMTEINEESFCSKGITEEQWMALHGDELEES